MGPTEEKSAQKYAPHNRKLKDAKRQETVAVNVDTLEIVFQNLEKRIQVCLDGKVDHFQHRLSAGPVLHRSRYVYINFQVIISIP